MSLSALRTTQWLQEMAMFVFLDTEFTDLVRPELLSIGMVAEDLQEFYVELDLATAEGQALQQVATDFVRFGPVLEQWHQIPGAAAGPREMGRRAGEWLLDLHKKHLEPLIVAFDYAADYELLTNAIRTAGLWAEVAEVMLPKNVDELTSTIESEMAGDAAFEDLAKYRGLLRHHALADAVVLRAAHHAATSARY